MPIVIDKETYAICRDLANFEHFGKLLRLSRSLAFIELNAPLEKSIPLPDIQMNFLIVLHKKLVYAGQATINKMIEVPEDGTWVLEILLSPDWLDEVGYRDPNKIETVPSTRRRKSFRPNPYQLDFLDLLFSKFLSPIKRKPNDMYVEIVLEPVEESVDLVVKDGNQIHNLSTKHLALLEEKIEMDAKWSEN